MTKYGRRFGAVVTAVLVSAGWIATLATVPAAAQTRPAASCNQPGNTAVFSCFSVRQPTASAHTMGYGPRDVHGGYGPADLRAAYALPASSTTATVAVIDAYDNPTAESDLAVYRAFYGLPACTVANGCFKKVNQAGGTTPLPVPDQGWAGESGLDLQMVSAVCPSCHILLVEANHANVDLYTAVQTAVRLGAKYVSMSWGAGESGNEATLDRAFFSTVGVVYTAASGDSGFGVSYPAASANVVAVGGTSLRPEANQRGWSESTWSSRPGVGTGSGCSSTVAKPAWQTGIPAATCGRRAVTDVSAVADPATGVAVYQSYGAGGWVVYGGTSAAAPIIAGVYALAGTPVASERPASYPYLHSSALNDVTTGTNGSCSASALCQAGIGWDGPTGLGTPNGVAAFNSSGTAPTTTTAPATPAPPAATTTASTGTSSGVATPQCAGQLISNGDFKYGSSGWSASRSVIRMKDPQAASGASVARLGGSGRSSSQALARAVTVPAGCKAVLTYRLRVISADTSSVAHDTLAVTVNDKTAQRFSNINRSAGYSVQTVKLPVVANGRTVIKWVERENNGLATSFLIDDVKVTLS